MSLKFFNNSTSKDKSSFSYFKYAFGEIFLVAIGILIALQVNNSNENRKRQNMEITILKNLQEDINLDTLDIQFNIKYHKIFSIQEVKLLNFLQSNNNYPTDSINYSNALGTPLVLALHKSTYQNLQNNKIGILSNNSLRKDIARFYDFFHRALTLLENDYPELQTYSQMKYYFKKYFRIIPENTEQLKNNLNQDDFYNPDFSKNKIMLSDYKGAKIDEGFKIELNESIFFRSLKIGFYEDMLNRSEILNKKIDEEIPQLEN